ncbi:MAG: hypothetical protein RQ875_09470 [Vicingaceae bacterium]|nr:hypothetical protein [Vicingaceae bacterium]
MSKFEYRRRKEMELADLKKQEAALSDWLDENNHNINDRFMQKYKQRNSIRHKINACKDRLSEKHKRSLGYEEVSIPNSIINNLNY